MRFDDSTPVEELNLISMVPRNPNSIKGHHHHHTKERKRYIHRCPFSHCPHQDMFNTYVETDPRGIKVSLNALVDTSSSYEDKWAFMRSNDLRQGHFVTRGAANPIHRITSQYRQRAILYMLNRMKVKRNLNTKIYNRLLASILTLEKQVFQESDSKEKYTENLATKLFLIFQELERRKSLSEGENPLYSSTTSWDQTSIKE